MGKIQNQDRAVEFQIGKKIMQGNQPDITAHGFIVIQMSAS